MLASTYIFIFIILLKLYKKIYETNTIFFLLFYNFYNIRIYRNNDSSKSNVYNLELAKESK